MSQKCRTKPDGRSYIKGIIPALQQPEVSHQLNVVTRLASEIRLMMRRPERLQFAALCYRKTDEKNGIEILLITSRGTGR